MRSYAHWGLALILFADVAPGGCPACGSSGPRVIPPPPTQRAEAPAASASEATAASPRCVERGTAATSPGDLVAHLTVLDCDPGPAADLFLNVRIHNTSTAPVKLVTLALPFGMLSYEVRRAGGEPLPLLPPPVPPVFDPERHLAELDPDQDYLFDGSLRGTISIDPEPGAYEIRFVYANADDAAGGWKGTLETPWVPFTIP